MKIAMGRGAALVAAIAAALTLALTGTAFAGGEGHGGGDYCKGSEAVGNGATPLNSFQFTMCEKSKNIFDVTGYFMASATPPANLLVAPKGPVTCADIKGNEVAFYYPFGAGSMPPANPAVTGLIVYGLDGGPNGAGDKIGFAPVLAGANANCSLSMPTAMGAKATALALTSGDIRITDHMAEMCDPKTGKPMPKYVFK